MYALPLIDPTVFLAILSALKLADLVTTHAVLKLDGSERNKVMAKLFEKLGIDGALILTGAIVVALGKAMANTIIAARPIAGLANMDALSGAGPALMKTLTEWSTT